MTGKHSGKHSGKKSGAGKFGEAHDHHHAQKRRQRREDVHAKRGSGKLAKGQFSGGDSASELRDGALLIYGLHTVRHALENAGRKKIALHVTRNAMIRLDLDDLDTGDLQIKETDPRSLDRMVGPDAVHQGAVLEVEPLVPRKLGELKEADLVLVLDQVTDPHNVGAILRSAIAFDATAVITTARHSPAETGVLAKAASGALDMIDMIQVRNLGECLVELKELGFSVIGLDSEGEAEFDISSGASNVALVLGSEGKGLRQKTRGLCDQLMRLDMPGRIKSLNVSNAAALSLYIVRKHLARSAGSDLN
ncbi:MAG: 23S rRNA (guanosine(2251)-2'-O)-methyltransferase RlmB [Rhizobiaceae bacterium]